MFKFILISNSRFFCLRFLLVNGWHAEAMNIYVCCIMLLNESGIMDALSISIQNFPSMALNKLLRSQRKEKGGKK